jgi:hypothetical protein
MIIRKPSSTLQGTGAVRCRAIYPVIGNCELCDKLAFDRHHIDGNRLNNNENNIMFLCRTHHMEVDGRLSRFKELPKKPRLETPRECKVCRKKVYPIRKGRCHSCNEYYRRNGIDKVQELIENRIISPCNECGNLFESSDCRRRFCEFCWPIILGNRHAYYELKRRKRKMLNKSNRHNR